MKVLAVGDSHGRYMGISSQVGVCYPPLRGITCIPKAINAATVTGVGKLKSTLSLSSDIPQWIGSARPDFLVMGLGQVDVELGIPFRHFVKGETTPSRELLAGFVDSYMGYMSSLDFPASRIVIKGINAPVLCYDRAKAIRYINRIVTERFTDSTEDAARQELVLSQLKVSYPSDIIRTDHAITFNAMLKEFARKAGYGYFDINSDLIDTSTGLIKTAYVPSGFDHHIVDTLDVRIMHWKHLLPVLRRQIWI